jgi:hypothetical protein
MEFTFYGLNGHDRKIFEIKELKGLGNLNLIELEN